ncbi:mucin-6-like [Rhincodon typus]|uniref:mucin-6-like n=1 Tax=Rhincodon typus TaxID=259920 RepID=UPI00202E46B4|nr:mucin-6-like [Rhincodon typus]
MLPVESYASSDLSMKWPGSSMEHKSAVICAQTSDTFMLAFLFHQLKQEAQLISLKIQNGSKVISPYKFASQYQVDDPSEACHPLNVTKLEETNVDYVSDCSCMLNKVAPLCKLPKRNYITECQRDLYKCTAKGDTQCSCQTLSEYSRQCSRLLEPVTNWRNISFCPPIPCPGNQVYQECGSPCLSTCSNPQTTCDSYGTYGCFCPEGTVLDDIATKDTCIPLSHCPCVLNGQVYAPGGSVNSPCKSCKCFMGKWNCTNLPCPGRCSIEGGSFITTFDSRRYRFHGVCTYLLIKSVKMLDSGTIEAVFDKSGVRYSETQLTSIIYATNQDILIKLTNGHYQITPPNAARGLKVINNPLYLKFDLKISSKLELTIIWNKNMNAYISITRLSEFAVCGLCGNYNGNADDEYVTQNKYLVSNVLTFANSWKEDPTCRDVTEVVFPCHKNPYRLARAEKMCAIINSKVFEPCHKLVYRMPYYDNCVRDTCGCELAGDCECLCDAVAVYAKACIDAGVCIDWRTPDFCPVYCDYFNYHKEYSVVGESSWNSTNRWHYQPCLCPANIHMFGKFNMEEKPINYYLPGKPSDYYAPEKPTDYYPPEKPIIHNPQERPIIYYPPGKVHMLSDYRGSSKDLTDAHGCNISKKLCFLYSSTSKISVVFFLDSNRLRLHIYTNGKLVCVEMKNGDNEDGEKDGSDDTSLLAPVLTSKDSVILPLVRTILPWKRQRMLMNFTG